MNSRPYHFCSEDGNFDISIPPESFPIRSVVMARYNEHETSSFDDGEPLRYTFYMSCGHFIKLPESIALVRSTRRIRTIARCYKCPLEESVYIETS